MNEYALLPYPFFFLILTYGYITQMKIKDTVLPYGVFAIVVVSWVIWPCFNDTPASSKEDSTNRFTYSALNTLFTGCAFWGAWMAYRTQRKGVEKAQEQTQIAKEQVYNALLFQYLSYLRERESESITHIKKISNQFFACIADFTSHLITPKLNHSQITSSIRERTPGLVQDIEPQYISDWANIVFEWENYVETADLAPKQQKDLFSRFWNTLNKEERCAVVLAGVYTKNIQKNEQGRLLGFQHFHEICSAQSTLPNDEDDEYKNRVSDILADVLFDHLPVKSFCRRNQEKE